MSASMAPTIDTGDMVVLKRLDRPARKGDIVSIRVPDEARRRFGYPPVVIHRVVAITPDGTVTTQGDALREARPVHRPEHDADHERRRAQSRPAARCSASSAVRSGCSGC